MSWYFNEIVRSGNSQARVKNYYSDTGFIVLYDIKGHIEAGMTVVGDESGTSLTLTEFNVSYVYDMFYEPDYWQNYFDDAVYDGDGNLIAIDAHFTGTPSQDYQTTYMVVQG